MEHLSESLHWMDLVIFVDDGHTDLAFRKKFSVNRFLNILGHVYFLGSVCRSRFMFIEENQEGHKAVLTGIMYSR